jgi:hypothetical protein
MAPLRLDATTHRRSAGVLPLAGAAAAGLIATIRELATDEQGRPSRVGYSMETGDESPATTTRHHHP